MRATLAISDIEALRGTTRTLTLPGGRRVNISVPAGAYDGQIIRLEGQGPPSDSGSPGALLIALAITPTAKSPAVSASDSTEATVRMSPSDSSGRISVPQRGLSRGNMMLLIALALVVIIGSIGFVTFYVTTNKQLANAIHAGYNQPNLVAVVAQGASLALYINQQLVTSVNDSSYSHGQIGVVAYDQGSPAQVVYSNARVWTL